MPGFLLALKGLSFSKIFKSGKFWVFVIVAIFVTALYIRDLGMRNDIATLETTVATQKASLDKVINANKTNTETINQLIADKELAAEISKAMKDRLDKLDEVYQRGSTSVSNTAKQEGPKKASQTTRQALRVIAEAKNEKTSSNTDSK